MTHGVVQSDIDFTRKLINAGCEDSAILASLRWRGIEEARAQRLLQDLQEGHAVRPEQPVTAQPNKKRRHRTTRRTSKGHHSATRGTTCPASRDPLYYHYDHRPRWRRVTKATLQLAALSLSCAGLIVCLLYIGASAWTGAQRNAEELDNRNPDWPARLYRYANDLPDTSHDDLKAQPPLPLKPGK